MSGFSFPPPPPPPPPGSQAPPPPPPNNRGGFNNRGHRGRGRGGNRGGFNHHGGHHNSSFNSQDQHSAPTTSGYPLPNYPSWMQQGGGQPAPSYQAPPPMNTMTYNQPQQPYPQTQGFYGQPMNQYQPPPQPVAMPAPLQRTVYPPPPHHGSAYNNGKRKHNQAFKSGSAQPKPDKANVPPKLPAPPAVPSFGFALPPKPAVPADLSTSPNQGSRRNKRRRKNNQLGLTPKGEEHEDSDEDIDEEAKFAASGQAAVIQHRGRTIELNTQADILKWIADRKSKYPTQERREARKAAEEARRKLREENRKKWAEEKKEHQQKKHEERQGRQAKNRGKGNKQEPAYNAAVKAEPATSNEAGQTVKTESPANTTHDDALAKIKELEEQLRQAREALAQGQKPPSPVSPIEESKTDTQDTIVKQETDATTADAAPTSAHVEAPKFDLGLSYNSEEEEVPMDESVSEASSTEPSSESDLSGSDSDAPPEESSAKATGPIKIAPPPREGPPQPKSTKICRILASGKPCPRGDQCMYSHDVPCRNMMKHGTCAFGDRCRYSHDVVPKTGRGAVVTVRKEGRVMGLRERMIEKELMEEAREVVGVICRMGEGGFFNEPPS